MICKDLVKSLSTFRPGRDQEKSRVKLWRTTLRHAVLLVCSEIYCIGLHFSVFVWTVPIILSKRWINACNVALREVPGRYVCTSPLSTWSIFWCHWVPPALATSVGTGLRNWRKLTEELMKSDMESDTQKHQNIRRCEWVKNMLWEIDRESCSTNLIGSIWILFGGKCRRTTFGETRSNGTLGRYR